MIKRIRIAYKLLKLAWLVTQLVELLLIVVFMHRTGRALRQLLL